MISETRIRDTFLYKQEANRISKSFVPAVFDNIDGFSTPAGIHLYSFSSSKFEKKIPSEVPYPIFVRLRTDLSSTRVHIYCLGPGMSTTSKHFFNRANFKRLGRGEGVWKFCWMVLIFLICVYKTKNQEDPLYSLWKKFAKKPWLLSLLQCVTPFIVEISLKIYWHWLTSIDTDKYP